MDFKNLAIFAVLGSIAAFWSQVKNFLMKIGSIFVRTDTYSGIGSESRIAKHLIDNSKIIRWGNIEWVHDDSSYPAKDSNQWIRLLHRKEKSLILLYKNKIPAVLMLKNNSLSLTYLYKTINFKKIIEDCYSEELNADKIRYNDNYTYYNYWESYGRDLNNSGKNQIPTGEWNKNISNSDNQSSNILPIPIYWLRNKAICIKHSYDDLERVPNEKESRFFWTHEAKLLKKDVEYWAKNSQWFLEREIPHRRSALLYGKPGTGKSRMVLEIAKKLQLEVHRILISNMSDLEFKETFYIRQARGIIIIEDIDSIFHGRENILAKNSLNKNLLSFDTLLNTLSGVTNTQNGLYIIMTTNHPELLDEALTRKGRLDLKIEVKYATKEAKRFIASNILKGFPEEIEKIIDSTEEMPASEFEGLCVERAKDLFYANAPRESE